jgi:hypothetical protein
MKDIIKQWKDLKRENYNCISLNNFIAYWFVTYFSIERLFLPVFIENKKVKFTNVCFTSNGSGDDYFLVDIEGKFFFLEYAYEPDCDGAYYTHSIKPLFDVTIKGEYELHEVYTNDILKMLQKY